jgi:hypothetical protein
MAPAGYPLASHINLKHVNKSRLAPLLKTLIQTTFPPSLPADVMLNMLQNALEAVFISKRDKTGKEQFAAIIKNSGNITAFLEQLKTGYHAANMQIGNYKGIKLHNLAAFAATDRTVVLGTQAAVSQIADLINTTGKTLTDQPGFSNFSIKKNSGILRYREITSAAGKTFFAPLSHTQFNWAVNIQKIDAAASLNNGLHANSKITLDSEKRAAAIKKQLNKQWSTLLSNPFLKLLNIGWLKKKLRITSSGKQLNIKISLANEDIKKLNRLITPLLQIQNMMK